MLLKLAMRFERPKKCRDRRDVPGVFVVKAVAIQGFKICIFKLVGLQADLHREVEHGHAGAALMSALR